MKCYREKIRIARVSKGYTQHYMAMQLDISQRAYSKIECGHTILSVERLLNIATILEIDAGNLLNELVLD
jgi:transcriptional regulator with XRE-family HTH domain